MACGTHEMNFECHFSAENPQELLVGGGPFDDGTYLVVTLSEQGFVPGATVWASIEHHDGRQVEMYMGLVISVSDGMVHTFWSLPPV